eukprot:TRINITY_DN23553_c0_g1_i1.p1 TRINITY_DN23553_c0_g1~~TRINITY_DN23553_c0_g1_i1.p1  ORF type:complete len:309 (-),score=35.11 TRINITY_DN23553_c0_g1_i1:201-1127(-)
MTGPAGDGVPLPCSDEELFFGDDSDYTQQSLALQHRVQDALVVAKQSEQSEVQEFRFMSEIPQREELPIMQRHIEPGELNIAIPEAPTATYAWRPPAEHWHQHQHPAMQSAAEPWWQREGAAAHHQPRAAAGPEAWWGAAGQQPAVRDIWQPTPALDAWGQPTMAPEVWYPHQQVHPHVWQQPPAAQADWQGTLSAERNVERVATKLQSCIVAISHWQPGEVQIVLREVAELLLQQEEQTQTMQWLGGVISQRTRRLLKQADIFLTTLLRCYRMHFHMADWRGKVYITYLGHNSNMQFEPSPDLCMRL